MPTIDLRNYIVNPSGNWIKDPDAFTATEFILSQADDEVTFTGPVAISVTLQSENRTLGPSGADEKIFYHDVYTYSLAIPPGHTYRYRFIDKDSANNEAQRVLGVNYGYRVLFRAGLVRISATPVMIGTDLPCDFAVSSIANSGQFFPAGCEPCPPGVPIGLPPGATPTLVPIAPGGCIRTRFFNGMFITREDMETEQRFFRMKNKLQNRAMGQGVVWGLNIHRYSNNICIEPGYAVDCCGNDLVVTEPYRVNIDALLRDPASFRFLLDVAGLRRSSVDDCDQPVPPGIIVDPAPQLCRRMHLLLEYAECPQDARPVHGDSCSPEVTSCEMSRIRETVRLRLVPPRDYDPTGPIDKFLNEVKAALGSTGIPTPAPGSTISTATNLPVPFQIDVNAVNVDFLPTPGFNGTVMPDRTVTQMLTLPVVQGGQTIPALPPYTVTFKVRPTSGYSVSAGQVTDKNGNVLASANPGSAIAFQWTDTVPTFPTAGFPTGTSFVDDNRTYLIHDWQAAPATGQPILTGTTLVTLAVRYTALQSSLSGALFVTIAWSVSVGPTDVQAVVPTLGPYPCNSEACGCDPNLLRFPVFPPFLHNDSRTGGPVDWKVLLLAVLYGLLVSEEARHHTGTPQAIVTPRLQVALAIYVAALRAFFGANTADQQEQLTRAMRCLFQAWCKALLYPGPQCEQGIHGVVIGCAQIHGGRIVDVDPWGGRRWVMHYPLLTYWGHQFGIAPLDLTASRLFSMICCLGGLTAPILGNRDTGFRGSLSSDTAPLAAQPVVAGHIMLVSGTRAEALQQLRTAGVVPAATRELSLPEFVSTLLLRLREQPTGAASEYTLFALKDSPDVHFAAPVAAEAAGAATVAVQPQPAAADALPALVHAAVDNGTRSSVPPLLRGLSENVSVSLLRLATIAGIAGEPDTALHKKLVEIGAGTYGALAGRDPQGVLKAVGVDYAKELSQILQEGEAVISSVTSAVFHGVASTAKETGAASARDLNNDAAIRKTAAAISHGLANEKHVNLSEALIANVLTAAVAQAVAP